MDKDPRTLTDAIRYFKTRCYNAMEAAKAEGTPAYVAVQLQAQAKAYQECATVLEGMGHE